MNKMIQNIKEIHYHVVCLFKIGSFYHAYGKDAYILSYFFKYKVKQLQDGIYVCGFPNNKLKSVMATFENKKMNYIVLDRKNDYREDEKFDNKNLNKYNEYLEKAIKYVKRKNQIDNIYKYLINNIGKNEIEQTSSFLSSLFLKSFFFCKLFEIVLELN